MPNVNFSCSMGVPNTKGLHIHRGFNEVIPIFEERNYTITGVTKDNAGAALGGCTVFLFNNATNTLEQTTISDGSGNYSFVVDKTQNYFTRAVNAGGTVVGGTLSIQGA